MIIQNSAYSSTVRQYSSTVRQYSSTVRKYTEFCKQFTLVETEILVEWSTPSCSYKMVYIATFVNVYYCTAPYWTFTAPSLCTADFVVLKQVPVDQFSGLQQQQVAISPRIRETDVIVTIADCRLQIALEGFGEFMPRLLLNYGGSADYRGLIHRLGIVFPVLIIHCS